MEINRKKLIYSILREANKNSDIKYEAETFKVDETLFSQVMKVIDDEKLIININGSNDLYNRYSFLFDDNLPIISLKGIEFLEENNAFVKYYKGLKEIKDWISL